MKTLAEIKQIVRENRIANRPQFSGLSSAEVGAYNRALMFGDSAEAFPSQTEWSAIAS